MCQVIRLGGLGGRAAYMGTNMRQVSTECGLDAGAVRQVLSAPHAARRMLLYVMVVGCGARVSDADAAPAILR